MNTDESKTEQTGGEAPVKGKNEESPFDSEFFFVEGVNFKCMAYRDNQGTWRGAFNHLELPGMIHVLG